jgi:hypothetical protein
MGKLNLRVETNAFEPIAYSRLATKKVDDKLENFADEFTASFPDMRQVMAYKMFRGCCKISHAKRFSNSRIMLI